MDKLTGKRKLKRDNAVRDFEREHPDYTQEQIADAFGISQGAVSKILKDIAEYIKADKEFIEGVEKGIKAYKEGKTRPWSEIKKELNLG